jgi:DNA-binding SARP family transcriptional activator
VARLCLAGRPARSAIAGELWPDVPEEHAQGSLRSALWRLQKAVPGLVDVSGSALRLSPGVRVDVVELSAWVRRVHDPASRPEDIAAIDPAVRAELLPGWYDDWVLLERERLRQLRMHGLEKAALRLAAAGRHGEALQAAYAAVRTEPLRESAHRAVVRVHLSEGNPTEAVRAYELFRVLIADELGVAPSPALTALVSGIPRPRSAPGAGPVRLAAVTAR